MVMHTWGVGLNVTPTVMGTSIDHYLNRKKRKQKPTVHLSYDVSLHLVRKFLDYASKHTVEDVQGFTAQWVPTPTWIHTEQIKIPTETVDKAATTLTEQLGPEGVKQIGGKTWWKWRHEGTELKAEWIEMKADRKRRQKKSEKSTRVMLYVHGGAYFFGSVDEHRYQMQRHARKLKARVLAPRYRLAPQFPFPCGLLDCLATYMHLLTVNDPTEIILAGDSAGGGMVVSLLVTLRDRGLPMPAGAILISPWVDLTHSFPSVSADNEFDYIPAHGFMQKPSMAWPPPSVDDLKSLQEARSKSEQQKKGEEAVKKGDEKKNGKPEANGADAGQNLIISDGSLNSAGGSTASLPTDELSLMIDGKTVHVREQIQMYATNAQLSNPLVSPVLQPSLGGLPPLLILVGGGEMLRDEQIYLAHKAANPAKYPPGEAYLSKNPEARDLIGKYKPTLVQLQVWDDLCHVAPTLSFTRPAKYMYRSIAQFGAWALAQAQRTDIEIVDDDAVSVISTDTNSSGEDEQNRSRKDKQKAEESSIPTDKIGKAGDDIPHFKNHMVRQRVDRHGNVYRLAAEQQLPALQVPPEMVGLVKPGPVRKWMAAKSKWDNKYASKKRSVQKRRLKEMKKGYREFKEDGAVELPPPSALAGRRGLPGTEAPKLRKSMGLAFWSMIGSSHDKDALEREEKLDRDAETAAKVTITQADGVTTTTGKKTVSKSRSGSHRRTVSYTENVNENTTAADLEATKVAEGTAVGAAVGVAAGAAAAGASSKKIDTTSDAEPPVDPSMLSPTFVPLSKAKDSSGSPVPQVLDVDASKDPHILEGTNVTLASPEDKRPKADGVAFPFKLNKSLGDHQKNASTVTLTSTMGFRPETPIYPETPKDEGARTPGTSRLSTEVSPVDKAAAAAATSTAAASAAVTPTKPSATAAAAAAAREEDADATPRASRISPPVVAGGAAAVSGAAAVTAATLASSDLAASRTTTSSTIETVNTVHSETVTTPPVVAQDTAFTSGPTLFPADGASSPEPTGNSSIAAAAASSTTTTTTTTTTTETQSLEKKELNGPVRTETPTLEEQLRGISLESRGVGPGDATPKGGDDFESTGWATPRAGSISTAAPSEAGDTLSRFETAEEE